MLCQNCQERAASVHFTQILNNKKIEMYLCEHCANEKDKFDLGPVVNLEDFLSGFISTGSLSQHPESEPRPLSCDVCGMSYEDFRKTGKLGCSNCYRVYGAKLNPILKRLHGNIEHTGKIPVKVSETLNVTKEIDKLKDLQAKAIQNEEYEKAAEIRDKIKQLGEGR